MTTWSDGLTGKQRLFVREYSKCLNATEAAKRAGYSEKTAASIGHENLRKPKIVTAIQVAMEELYDAGGEVTQDMVVAGLLKEARYSRSDSARVTAWSWLGRYFAMFTDKSQVEIKGLADRIAAMGEDEVRELLELSHEDQLARLGMTGFGNA